jgi:ferric-dicitrate binding protein FerR (iron transport regulator)
VEILNEAYQSNIVIEDPAIAALKLNASFKDESLDTILQVIAETFKIRIIAEDDKIILKY